MTATIILAVLLVTVVVAAYAYVRLTATTPPKYPRESETAEDDARVESLLAELDQIKQQEKP